MHVLYLVVEQEACSRLLEAHHVFCQRFACHSVEVLREVVGRVADVENWPLAEESKIHRSRQDVFGFFDILINGVVLKIIHLILVIN